MIPNISYRLAKVNLFLLWSNWEAMPSTTTTKPEVTQSLMTYEAIKEELKTHPRLLAQYEAARRGILAWNINHEQRTLKSVLNHNLNNFSKFRAILQKNPEVLNRIPYLDKLYSELEVQKTRGISSWDNGWEKGQLKRDGIKQIQELLVTSPDITSLTTKLVKNPFQSFDENKRESVYWESKMISAMDLLNKIIPVEQQQQGLIENAFIGVDKVEASRIAQSRTREQQTRQNKIDRVASIRVWGKKLAELPDNKKRVMTNKFLKDHWAEIASLILSFDAKAHHKPSGDLIADALRWWEPSKIKQMQELLWFKWDTADGVMWWGSLVALENFINERDTVDRKNRFALLNIGQEYTTNPNALASMQDDIRRTRLAWQQSRKVSKNV